MAIAIAGQATVNSTTNATSYTLTGYTPAAGSNRVLVVAVHVLRVTDDTAAFTVNSVTFGGVSLTEAATARHTSSSRVYRSSLWYLVNPSSSAGDIVATLSTGAGGGAIVANTLTGVAQATPLGETGSNTSDSAGITAGVSSVEPGSLLVAAVTSHCQDNPTWTWADDDSPDTSVELYEILAGVNTTRYKVTGFAVGAFFAGVAGGLLAHLLQIAHPTQYGFYASALVLIMVYAGGMGSLPGSIIAAFFLTFLTEVLRVGIDWLRDTAHIPVGTEWTMVVYALQSYLRNR